METPCISISAINGQPAAGSFKLPWLPETGDVVELGQGFFKVDNVCPDPFSVSLTGPVPSLEEAERL